MTLWVSPQAADPPPAFLFRSSSSTVSPSAPQILGMIPPLVYLDRYRNEGTRVYSPHAGYSEAESRFRPDSPHPSFRLPVFTLPPGEVNLYESDPSPVLRHRYLPRGRVLFCVHPQVVAGRRGDPYLKRILDLGRPEAPLRVSPSSSTRTLYVNGSEPAHALKVHFPFRVSRYGRRMRDEVVEQALRVSRELQAGTASFDHRFAFQREVLGVTLRRREDDGPRGENWGYLVRELEPFPPPEEERPLAPAFSLFGRDFFDPEATPLVFQLLGGSDPRDFVLEKVMFPVIRHWVSAYLHFGFLLEPHGQNVLLEVGSDGGIERIVHRDLNLGIDLRRRRDLGLPVSERNRYNQMEGGAFASITYDKFMGNHFFQHLVAALQERYRGLAMEDFQGPCRDLFAQLFPHHRAYLPRTVRYFSEDRDEFGKPVFLDTGEAPVWRP